MLSPSFPKLLGWSESELKARPFMTFVHPEDVESTIAEFEKLQTGVDTLYFENRYRRRDGSYLWLAWNAHAQPSDGLLYSAAHDITPMKESQRQLEAARDEAEASNRAKTDFLAKMSHELRTPLNSVIGFASVLLDREPSEHDEQEHLFLERIRANGTHLLALINDVLDISRVEAKEVQLELSSVDLVALVKDCVAEMESRVANSSVRLRAEVPTQSVEPVRADPRRMRQVLLNLLDNAIKFTTHGTITLRVVARRQGGRPLRVEVEDTGPGIAAEDLPRAFEAFQQVGQGLDRKYQGTGLGLSISSSLCRLMGFELEARSKLGSGTTFRSSSKQSSEAASSR
ncbi:MAG: PAS domain-containing protein [Thermoanaerobaculia bacterium]|nr:PAS domain-containing protein [Thermoanaerobaculia bacterium]